METMTIMTGNTGTKGALCRDSVRPLGARRVRIGTDVVGGAFDATIATPATHVSFPLLRAVD